MLEKLLAATTAGRWEVQPVRTGRGGRKSSSWLVNIVCYGEKYPDGRIIAKSLETKDAEWIVAIHSACSGQVKKGENNDKNVYLNS